jgi:putative membrane protein
MVFAESGKLERALHPVQPRDLACATDRAFYLSLPFLGALLWWASRYHASLVPVWGPWEFSWPWFLATALALWWYGRGLSLTAHSNRPASWRTVAYFAGIIVIYASIQTHFEYLAQHMFFLNRVQQTVMHDVGPFLVALAWPGAVIYRGMPRVFQRLTVAPPMQRMMRMFKQPLLTSLLFVAVVAVWLVPTIHFRAMVDPKLYQVMNWSMVIDGLVFWMLVLDPRPKPPAFLSIGARLAMLAGVMLPQIMIGAIITLAPYDLYAFYDWCGRIYPTIGALEDQQLGGLIIWIPPAMMNAMAIILVINTLPQQGSAHRGSESREGAYSWRGE